MTFEDKINARLKAIIADIDALYPGRYASVTVCLLPTSKYGSEMSCHVFMPAFFTDRHGPVPTASTFAEALDNAERLVGSLKHKDAKLAETLGVEDIA